MNTLFYSFISLLAALFFILLGIGTMSISLSPQFRTDLIQFILENSIAIFLFGFSFFIIGMAIVINITWGARKSYYQLSSGPRSVLVDEAVIQDYLDSYWKEVFPQSKIPSQLTLKKNKIYLTTDLPYIPYAEQKAVLERINHDLSEMFAKFLGYRQPFYLSASFQPENQKAVSHKE